MANKKYKIILVEGTPEWMISFGDLLSCLLVFFILLLTFSSKDSGKIMDMIGETETPGAPGEPTAATFPGESGSDKNKAVDPDSVTPVNVKDFLVSNTFFEFKQKIFKLGFRDAVTVQNLSDGIQVSIPADSLFENDKGTTLTYRGTPLIESIANVIRSIGNELRVSFLPTKDSPSDARLTGFTQTVIICETLHDKYSIPISRLSYGSSPKLADAVPVFTFLIASKIDEKILTIHDFIKKE